MTVKFYSQSIVTPQMEC